MPLQLINKEIVKCKNYIEDPEKLPHEEHLKQVELFVKSGILNFDNLDIKQRVALLTVFYVVFGIFGGKELNGFDMICQSDLTIGAGTGSSASYAVCLAGVFLQFAKGLYGNEVSFEEKTLISKWAYNCERIMHGTPSGAYSN